MTRIKTPLKVSLKIALSACLYAEILKVKRSKVFIATIIAMSIAPIMGALFTIVLRSPELSGGNAALMKKAALTGFTPDWPSFLNLIAQAIGVGGIIVFGFIASWVFGREYSDRTAKDLFVLPVSRTLIVAAKMLTIVLWSIFICLIVLAEGLTFGYFLALPGWSIEVFFEALRLISVTSVLVIILSAPVTFIASIGKGYLAPLAFVVLTVVFAQIIGALGFGVYFPWALPAIYSKIIGAQSILNFTSYFILIATSIAGLAATIYYWKYVDQTM